METEIKKEYAAPSIQLLGSVTELTAGGPNDNGCGGGGHQKAKTASDGFGNGETGCVLS